MALSKRWKLSEYTEDITTTTCCAKLFWAINITFIYFNKLLKEEQLFTFKKLDTANISHITIKLLRLLIYYQTTDISIEKNHSVT